MTDDMGKPEIRNHITAGEMLYNYIEQRTSFFKGRDFTLLNVERPFAVPLDENQPNLIYVGRIDKEFKAQGRVFIGEHKTTTMYKREGPFRSQFVDSFSPNSQVDGYLYSGYMKHGKAPKACWIDAALVHRDEHDGFRFIPIERQLQQLSSWTWETLYWIKQIQANEAAADTRRNSTIDYMAAFPKNTNSCMNFSKCSNLDMCKMWSNPQDHETPPGFAESRWEPFDERLLNKAKAAGIKISKDTVLFDNTRLQSFKTCPRMYYFRHVRDWMSTGERRALLFGSSWHAAMDLVWKSLARKYEGN